MGKTGKKRVRILPISPKPFEMVYSSSRSRQRTSIPTCTIPTRPNRSTQSGAMLSQLWLLTTLAPLDQFGSSFGIVPPMPYPIYTILWWKVFRTTFVNDFLAIHRGPLGPLWALWTLPWDSHGTSCPLGVVSCLFRFFWALTQPNRSFWTYAWFQGCFWPLWSLLRPGRVNFTTKEVFLGAWDIKWDVWVVIVQKFCFFQSCKFGSNINN